MDILTECGSCGGTGLYRGMCESEGTAVICINCGGTGAEKHTYKEYTGRKHKTGVNKISYSRGSFIGTGVGAVGDSMTYYEFEKKIPEYKKES